MIDQPKKRQLQEWLQETLIQKVNHAKVGRINALATSEILQVRHYAFERIWSCLLPRCRTCMITAFEG